MKKIIQQEQLVQLTVGIILYLVIVCVGKLSKQEQEKYSVFTVDRAERLMCLLMELH